MKRFLALAAALALTLAGCAGPSEPSSLSSSAEDASSQESSGLSPEETQPIQEALETMIWESSLTTDWVGWPEEKDIANGRVGTFEVLETEQDGDTWWVTAELYGSVFLDPDTLTDTLEETDRTVCIQAEGEHAPFLTLGTAHVEFRKTEDGLVPLSCDFEGSDNPGVAYLQERTRELEAQLSASPTIDVSQYDPLLVDYVWRLILAHRYIESPEEITQWDMENLITDVVLNYYTLVGDGSLPENYVADPEIFRLATGLETFNSYLYLTDYSIFENMDQLDSIFLSCDLIDYSPDFSTLKIGHTRHLAISGFQKDFALDLTGSQVEELELQSYMAGVTGFTGCQEVRSLYISGTRTDMTLINAENFPGLEYLTFDIFSDTPRSRDFSKLATFGEDVFISLSLNYQACNDDTLATLAGVRLNSLYLDPYASGQWPLGDPDPEILAQIDAEELTVVPAP
jgi:hypothetical protein